MVDRRRRYKTLDADGSRQRCILQKHVHNVHAGRARFTQLPIETLVLFVSENAVIDNQTGPLCKIIAGYSSQSMHFVLSSAAVLDVVS